MGNSNSRISRISDSVDHKHAFVRSLGSGSFGFVSAVRNKATGKVIARKDIHYGIAGTFWGMWTDAHQCNAALNEIRLLKGLRHPNIVKYLGYQRFEEQKTFSIYMECCDLSLQGLVTKYESKGCDDKHKDQEFNAVNMTKNRIPGELLIHVSHSLARTLKYLHDPNLLVLHRDIKPANVLLNYRPPSKYPEVKVTDFGISTLRQSRESTRTLGTPAFMAPELMDAITNGRSPCHSTASDIYAFGATVAILYNSSTLKDEKLTRHSERLLASMMVSCFQPEPSKRPSAVEVHKLTAPFAPSTSAPRIVSYLILSWLTALSALYALFWCPLKRTLFCSWGLMNMIATLLLVFFLGRLFHNLKHGVKSKPSSLFTILINLGLNFFISFIFSKQCP